MKVQILYFEGCPNHPPAVELVKRVANELGTQFDIEEIEVRNQQDAERLRFLGSPTIQVDGVDVEPAAEDGTEYAYSCRMYGTSGLPSEEVIRAALQSPGDAAKELEPVEANKDTSNRSAMTAVRGSVVAAIVASACCWLPPLLLAIGVSAAGIGASFTALRPWMLGGAFLLLGAGFYLSYTRKSSCCEPGAACGNPNPKLQRVNRGMLWFALLAVLVFAFVPNYLGLTVDDGSASLPANMPQITLTVDGMSCEACATTIRDALREVPGVAEASVSYKESMAVVAAEATDVQDENLVQAVEQAGFRVNDVARDR